MVPAGPAWPDIHGGGLPFRQVWERGITRTPLTAHTRLVALALATHADYTTGTIPEPVQPYLDGLSAATGLEAGRVVVALNVLQARMWIRRTHREERPYEQTVLELTVPAPLLPALCRPSAREMTLTARRAGADTPPATA
ncbi:hypothetical protein [Streptomyces sp. CAU 1734]|uniref:hypothetical protein n=1 Tax=Streptomyces sp. CAU 1734 TaxID=3140360 RepID=UPI003260516D